MDDNNLTTGQQVRDGFLTIELLPEGGEPYVVRVEIDRDALTDYADIIEYIQEVVTPQHEWRVV